MANRFVLLMCLLLTLPVTAEIADYPFTNPEDEQRFIALSEKLRCLVCQNQNLADSNAELARDLRSELYKQIQQGHADATIIDFMTQRYGDFILYQPRFVLKNALLWLGPLLLFAFGVSCLIRFSNKTRQLTTATEMADPAQLAEIRKRLTAELDKQ